MTSPTRSVPRMGERALYNETHRGWSSPWPPPWLDRLDLTRVEPIVSGPLATLLLAVLVDQLARHGLLGFDPLPLFFLVVAAAGVRGGPWAGVVSGLLAALYSVHYLADAGLGLHYTPEHARDLLLAAGAAPLLGAFVGYAAEDRRGIDNGGQGVGDDRLRLVSGAAAQLAVGPPHAEALSDVAAQLVPALADWCTIHLLHPDGSVAAVGCAHSEPARELIVQAMRRHSPIWPPAAATDVALVRGHDEHDLARYAPSEELRALIRELAPGELLFVPVTAHGAVVGVITLGINRPARFQEEDRRLAGVLATAVGAAVERDALRRDACEARQLSRRLFDAHPSSLWIFDAETLRFLAVNDAAVRQYGYSREEFLALDVMALKASEDDLVPGGEHRRAARADVAIAQHRRKDGSLVDVEIASHEFTFEGRRARLALTADVTEQTRARAALHESEEALRRARLESAAGRLSRGLAHDFNDLLTTIEGFSEIVLGRLPTSAPERDDVEEIRRAAQRGTLLSRQLLAFGRNDTPRLESIDVNEIVRGLESLLQRLVGADVQLGSVLATGVGHIHADRAQLEQLLVTLVLEARDAMRAGGTLQIETGERQVGAGRHGSLNPGRYVRLLVRDSGEGLDPSMEIAGLYSIVRQAGGVVRVTREPGQGSTVKLYWPVYDEPDGIAPPPRTAGRAHETILVVEDEQPLRDLVRKVLLGQGYAVLEARHGGDALRLVEHHRGPLDLVVSDCVMPEMGGGELCSRLLPLRPGIRTLLISGYPDDELVGRGAGGAGSAFLKKPFTSAELLGRVRELLDAPTGAAVVAS